MALSIGSHSFSILLNRNYVFMGEFQNSYIAGIAFLFVLDMDCKPSQKPLYSSIRSNEPLVMRKIILNTAVSLDNYIARPDGSVDWLNDPDYELPDEDYGLGAFYKSIDTTLMGNNTYQEILGFDVPFPYPDTANYVFTRSNEHRDTEYVRFINEDPVSFVKELRKGTGKDIWLVGGGQLNALLLENNLIDLLILTLIPCILGQGIPLFYQVKNDMVFDLVSTKEFSSGLVQVTLKRKLRKAE